MFKRKFKNEFEFSEDSFLLKDEEKAKEFDHSIFVVYDKSELIDFLKLDYKGRNFLLCLFDKQLQVKLSIFDEIKNFNLIDASKTRAEVFKDLKLYFKKKTDSATKFRDMNFLNFKNKEMPDDDFQKALFFMI